MTRQRTIAACLKAADRDAREAFARHTFDARAAFAQHVEATRRAKAELNREWDA